MFLSTVFLIVALIPFMIAYEKKKMKARDIALLATQSAITVVCNLICAYTIPFHAGTAMVILTGIALGPEAGFITGVLSRFICNFFMGQGVWTLWEMAAWGILGIFSGVMFQKIEKKGYLQDKKKFQKENIYSGMKSLLTPGICMVISEIVGYVFFLFIHDQGESFFGWRIYAFGVIGILLSIVVTKRKLHTDAFSMTIFTFVSVFVVYGGIMNLAAYFMTGTDVTKGLESLKLLYITGVPYDFMHALGASICVFLAGETIVRKLERMKIKYGMYKK